MSTLQINQVMIALVCFSMTSLSYASGRGWYAPEDMMQPVQQENPSALLKTGFAQLRHFFKDSRPGNKERIEHFVNTQLVPYFDFEYMTKWSGGRLYRESNPRQRAKMQGYLRQTFLSNLIKNLATYRSQQVKVGRTKQGRRRNEAYVNVWLRKAQGYIVKVKFRLYDNGQQWKVFDVSADGSSAMIHYRRHFQQQYRKQQRARIESQQW
ncbi:MAG: ABC transporter substrate-binding protein [Methylococcales bacterium]|jgi:phospholipid transport system substrate-binding protein|nr:ABC transporter substrate-binding protein [Methylococcales bacterium]MBT7444092.1 ABC transporter substrate-binding protein [Methylococcales bacterium]